MVYDRRRLGRGRSERGVLAEARLLSMCSSTGLWTGGGSDAISDACTFLLPGIIDDMCVAFVE